MGHLFPHHPTYHIAAVRLIIIYIPLIFSVLALFMLNICIKDAEPNNSSRTKGIQVFWDSKNIQSSKVLLQPYVPH